MILVHWMHLGLCLFCRVFYIFFSLAFYLKVFNCITLYISTSHVTLYLCCKSLCSKWFTLMKDCCKYYVQSYWGSFLNHNHTDLHKCQDDPDISH